MAPQIENRERENSATEVFERTGERENEALLQALERWKQRRWEEPPPANDQERMDRFWSFLENEIWANHPPSARRPLTREEEDKILGYGPEGV
jgi:antitoxin VapB